MLSKYLPWEFFSKHPSGINSKEPGLYSFLINDPFLEKMLMDKFPKKELEFSLYSGSDLTKDFIEEHFLNLSFFSNQDNIRVMNAEQIPTQVLSLLTSSQIDWSNRFLVLFFSKSSKNIQEFLKHKDVRSIEIEPARFWEGSKLWQFCVKQKNINVTQEMTNFILENLEHTTENFDWVLETIKINSTDNRLSIAELKRLFKKERWDFFALAEIFTQQPNKFFQEILLKEEKDFEWFRSLFAFMQAHLVKVLTPESLKEKSKLSQYDQNIMSMCERWPQNKVKDYLQFFSECEILAKSRDSFLIDKLRLKIIKSI